MNVLGELPDQHHVIYKFSALEVKYRSCLPGKIIEKSFIKLYNYKYIYLFLQIFQLSQLL